MLIKVARRAVILWARFWLRFASLSSFGRFATRIATSVPLPYVPYYLQQQLAYLSEFGYVSGSAGIYHNRLQLGRHIFIHDDVSIICDEGGGPISLEERVCIEERCMLSTGQNGSIQIGEYTSVGSGSWLVAYLAGIHIGSHTMIGPDTHFYSYNHGVAPGVLMQQQPLATKGEIIVEDDVWIGRGATILSGVRIGKGAVVGAGAVVTRDVPPDSIVAGNPARVVRYRTNLALPLPVDNSSEAIIVRRWHGTIKYWNAKPTSLYGWEREEAMDKQTHSLFKTTFPKPLAQIETDLVSNKYWSGTLVHLRKDGVRMIVQSRWHLQEAERGETDIVEINQIAS